MSPALMILANRSLPFHLYDFHLDGVTAKELAFAHSMPIHCVEERIEAVRLCLKFQAKVTVGTKAMEDQLAAA